MSKWFVVSILRFQQWFDVDVFDFEIEDIYKKIAWLLFWLLFTKMGNLIQSSGHPEKKPTFEG